MMYDCFDPTPPLPPQSFLSLVNLLSSPHAVWELLGHQPLPNKAEYNLREMPISLTVSLDVNTDPHTLRGECLTCHMYDS